MKKAINNLALLFVLFVIVSGCLKSKDTGGCHYVPTSNKAPQREQDSLKAYLDTMHIAAKKHPNGFYYEIITPGASTDTIGVCSQIQISYVGKLLKGTGAQFDSQSNIWLTLGALIDGWKYGIPLIGKGGRIKLYIPPSLGYGNMDITDNTGHVAIPKNSDLMFDITLMDYTKQN